MSRYQGSDEGIALMKLPHMFALLILLQEAWKSHGDLATSSAPSLALAPSQVSLSSSPSPHLLPTC